MAFWKRIKKIGPQSDLAPYYINTNIVLWVLLVVLGGVALWRYYHNRVFISRDFEFQPVETAQLPATINPNEASWPSLARLPGMGESKAKAVVAFREAWVKDHPSGPRAFEKPDDLGRVKGLGPATIDKLKPYLIFGSEAGAKHDGP